MPGKLLLSLAACALLHTTPSTGQSVASTGVVMGKVADTSGAPVPEVRVVITGDGLIASRTATTDEEGVYRFPGLPSGDYALAFYCDGFANARREAVHVGIGFTATVDVELELAGVIDRVVVTSGSSPIDRQTMALTASLDARQLAHLPNSRSLFAILAATPALHVTRFEVGSSSGEVPHPYGAYGVFGANRPMIEGIAVSGIFATGFMLNYGAFAEASVGLAGHSADWPLPGVQMQVVTKSGGDQYHGTVYADFEPRRWQSINIDGQQVARGAAGGGGVSPRDANRLWSSHDVNADVGGYFRRGAAWWYFSFRDHAVSTRLVNFPVEPHRTHSTNYNAKGTYRIGSHQTVVLFGQAGRTRQPNRLDPFGPAGGTLSSTTAINDSEDATLDQLTWGWIGKAEWTSIAGDAVLFEVRAGAYGTQRTQTPHGAAPRFEDIGTLVVRGGNRNWQESIRRPQVLGSVSYFRAGWLGTHAFRFGGEILQTTRGETWRQGFPGDVLHVLRNGAPAEVYLFQTPSFSQSGVRSYSGYATDAWRLNDRLAFSLGLRFDRYRVFLPAQAHAAGRFNPTEEAFPAVDDLIVQNAVVPRVGLIVTLSHDARTLAKINYARYSQAPGLELTATINPNADQWWRRHAWADANGNGVWDGGEEGRLLAARGGAAVEALDPSLRLGFIREAAASLERELGGATGVRASIIWRDGQRPFARQNLNRPFEAFSVPVLVTDPGPDGSVGTSDDGAPIRAYDLPAEQLLLPPINVVRNVPGASNQHVAIDISATRRFRGRWSFVAGFEHTWSREHGGGYFGQSVRNNVFPLTPTDLINTGDEGRHEFRTWSVKAYGTYEGPRGVRVTPLLRHQSGQPYGRTFSTALSYGAVRILAEPIGTRRMRSVTIVDLGLEKGFRLMGDRRVAGFVDVFNLFNTNAEQNASWSSGSFLRPLTIVSPRIARVGMKLEW